VDSQIAAETARRSQANPTTLESLYSRRAELSSKISNFDAQAQQAGIGAPQIAAGTQIVDAPRITPQSLVKTAATDGGIGLALGLALGLAVAAVGSVVRDRPVFRRDIAEHLGASVIAQLPPRRRWLWRRASSAAERRRVAATLERVVRTQDRPVSLLDLGAPAVTAALAVDIAEGLAATGPVVVVDDLAGQDLARLAGAAGGPLTIVDAGAPPPARGSRRLGVGSVAPGTAWTDLRYLGTETVLVVRTGQAGTSWLHTVARQLADCEILVIGVVLVDPDPKDRTDGTLWDGLHMALRGHASRATPGERTTQLTPLAGNGRGSSHGELPARRFAPVGAKED
jgi:hypothetical protein